MGVGSVPRFSIAGLGFRVLAQTARGFWVNPMIWAVGAGSQVWGPEWSSLQ